MNGDASRLSQIGKRLPPDLQVLTRNPGGEVDWVGRLEIRATENLVEQWLADDGEAAAVIT